MKKWILALLTVLLFLFSSCAAHKEPSLAKRKSLEKDFLSNLNQASFFLRQNEPDKAIDYLNKAISLDESSSLAYNLLGIAYFQRKEFKLAERQYKKAAELNPSYAQAYGNLGSVYFMIQEFDRAEEMFKKAISLSPTIVSAYYGLGTLLLAKGQLEESVTYLSKAIELDPTFLERNKAFVAGFASRTFNNPEIFFIHAKLFAAVGDIEKTVEYLKKAEQAGFKDWQRIETEKEFEKVRENEKIRSFIH